MTVEELLYTSIMKKAKVLAGEKGLGRSVTWCALDNVVDFDNWVMPGTLIMYTGMKDAMTPEKYVNFMHEQEASGILLLRTGEMREERIIELCNQYDLPLLLLSYNVNIIDFTRRVSVLLSNDVDGSYRFEEWLKEICYSSNYKPDPAAAEYYGYNSKLEYFCLYLTVLEAQEFNEIKLEYQLLKAKHYLVKRLSVGDSKALAFDDLNRVILFFPKMPAESLKETRQRVNISVRDLMDQYGLHNVKAYIGSRASEIDDFSKSYRDAIKTVEFTNVMSVENEVISFEDWGMYMYMLSEPRPELERRMFAVLGDLIGDREAVATIIAYFDNNESIKKTSEALFIHISTLKYRLSKIEKILGINLSNSDEKYRLYMALVIYRFLKYE